MADKSDKDSALVKSSGAPDLKKMREKKNALPALKSQTRLITTGNLSRSTISASLQVLMMFDVTGSMFSYFNLVREKIQNIASAVKKESPGAEFSIFAYRNHGDEDRYEQIYYTHPFTQDLNQLFAYLQTIKKGGGGPDALTCMEDCFLEANKLSWDPLAPKAIVVIGDMPPHGVVDSVSKCYKSIDYRHELDKLYGKKVKIYSVFCGKDRKRIREFYQAMARESKGKFLEISQIDILEDLLIGICMKEAGSLDKYMQQLETAKKLTATRRKTLLMLKG